ncbi:MAG: hypothetical protein AAGK02_04520 [Pseudomonadota bacterium]
MAGARGGMMGWYAGVAKRESEMQRTLIRTVAAMCAIGGIMVPGALMAQAEVSAKVDWANDKPQRVQFQSQDGNTDFADRSSHYIGEKQFDDVVYSGLQIVVRYDDGSSAPFSVRAQLNARPFAFTVDKPSAALSCNLTVVEAMEPRARSSDQSVLIATMQKARALQKNRTAPCPGYLNRRVAKAYFDANCNLAKRTSFFDISPDARNAVLEAYRGHRALNRIRAQVSACEKQVKSEIIKPVAASMRIAVNDKDFDRYDALDESVVELLRDPEWEKAANAILPSDHFEDLREEAGALEQRYRPIEEAGGAFEGGGIVETAPG